ncbi:multidrug transporter [Saccharospirillum alexandrii]|uniref:multidrug transporter n=1 Tax=Saccharospirillum alexandrii TaxID=2448477 RepID=UPI003734DD82
MKLMTQWPLFAVLVLPGLVLAYIALRLLLRRGWVRGFVRGTLGVACLVGLVILGLFIVDLAAYRAFTREMIIATLSFSQQGEQIYEVNLETNQDQQQRTLVLNGDEWQLDARVLTWSGPLVVLGMEPVYRLDRISGRYQTVERELNAARTVIDLRADPLWSASEVSDWLPWVNARFGSSVFLPMVDNGLFEVVLGAQGLVARPVNEPARDALGEWFSD